MNKNIFFIFPPGYSGNYLQWICNVSEASKTEFTVKDPLLPNGTSHGFVRRPTHTGVFNILNWIIKNQPTSPQTYILFANISKQSWIDHPAHAAYRLLKSYPNGLIVNIYANSNDEAIVGALNSYTKWTTWMHDQTAFGPSRTPAFDWEGGKNNIISLDDRNWLFENWRTFFSLNDQPFNWGELTYNIEGFRQWYKVRKELEPAETDADQFNNFETFPTNNIIDVKLGDIYNQHFFENTELFSWLDTQHAGEFDWNYAKQYHQKYIAAQDNLRWFTDINVMRNHKQVSKWLLKHSFGQALVLEEIAEHLDQVEQWQSNTTENILTSLGYTILN
jgi:hypothetical protein